MKHNSETTPAAEAVEVLRVWNDWVEVRFPDTGETTWVDLRETPWEAAEAPPEPFGSEEPAAGEQRATAPMH